MTQFLLDTSVLISHTRGLPGITELLSVLVRRGHGLGTSCVNVTEYERGTQDRERRRARLLLDRLRFFETTREAARRAGAYQREFARGGVTIHLADALVAGTARAHGAIVVTDNTRHFPMPDVRAVSPEDLAALIQ